MVDNQGSRPGLRDDARHVGDENGISGIREDPRQDFKEAGRDLDEAGPPTGRTRADRMLRKLDRIRIPLFSPALNMAFVATAVIFAIFAVAAPDLSKRYPLAVTLQPDTERELILMTADGVPFARRGGCVDAPVSLEEVPKHLVDAVLAMEDRRFYEHFGIDPEAVLRAALANHAAGKIVQGGSTITQQLAKITYLSGVRTFDRKLEEALIALRLELNLTKDQILERYLSRAFFGEGCFGLRAAARHYFGKPVSALTLPESIYLVALLRSPSQLSASREDARQREKLILKAMLRDGRLKPADVIDVAPAELASDRGRQPGAYYADWIAGTVKSKLPKDGDMTPLAVRTTFDPQLQLLAEAAVAEVMEDQGAKRDASQAAIVVMRPDGRTLALVGGRDYGESQFNRAFQALRQPGSSFKTFVYLAALRAGADGGMRVPDEPISIGDWEPENYSGSYRGVVSIKRAFASSINSVAVRLSETVGREHVIAAARNLGITTPLPNVPSLALGVAEVTLLEQTSAYAAIAAGAYPVQPWGVLSFDGNAPGAAEPPKNSGLWKLEAADELRALLAAVVRAGTGGRARLPIEAYGKTGTSQDYRDAWFIGFAGNLVVGVWVGNDDFSPMQRVTGGSLPAQIWRVFMDKARKSDPEFTPQLKEVAAFRARAKNRLTAAANWDDLETLSEQPASQDRRVSASVDDPRHIDRPPGASLFGPLPETRRSPRRPSSSRSLRDWVTMRDGG